MEIKLKRVWSSDMSLYAATLDKYNAEYKDNYALIKIESVEQLFSIAKEINRDLIISYWRDIEIDIYDDYVE